MCTMHACICVCVCVWVSFYTKHVTLVGLLSAADLPIATFKIYLFVVLLLVLVLFVQSKEDLTGVSA